MPISFLDNILFGAFFSGLIIPFDKLRMKLKLEYQQQKNAWFLHSVRQMAKNSVKLTYHSLTAKINPQNRILCRAGKCFGLHCCGIKLWLFLFYVRHSRNERKSCCRRQFAWIFGLSFMPPPARPDNLICESFFRINPRIEWNGNDARFFCIQLRIYGN